MPRKPRIHVPGGVYHVILRGNSRQPLFLLDSDRRFWMRLLADGIDRYRCRIHAYCWMTNHVHLAVQVSDLPLGLFIGWAASQYARATKRRVAITMFPKRSWHRRDGRTATHDYARRSRLLRSGRGSLPCMKWQCASTAPTQLSAMRNLLDSRRRPGN